MDETHIVDMQRWVRQGELFRPPDDRGRVEAFIPPMARSNHAPNMAALPSGDLLCVWFAGSSEGAGDIRIAMSRLGARAAQWTPPVWVSQDESRSEQNPILFPSPAGALWLLYTAQETRGCSPQEWAQQVAAGTAEGGYTMQWTAEIRRRISLDGGRTWGPVEVFSSAPGSFCRQPLVALSNGHWLLPMYYSPQAAGHGEDHTVMRLSEDEGQNWQEVPVPGSRGRVHASVVEPSPGLLLAFFRSRAADRIYVSHSHDYGCTWTAPERTALPNNNASIQALRLASGSVALIFNHASSANDDPQATVWPGVRYPVTLALSDDCGETWPVMRHIDAGDGFAGPANAPLNRECAYPCILQTPDGLLHIGYSYRGRQCIKYVRVSEAWVRDGRERLYD